MLRRTANFLRGAAELEVTGDFPEGVFNRLAAEGIPFWGIRWGDKNTVWLRVARGHGRRAAAAAEAAGCVCTERAGAGLPAFLLRFRRRYALLAGLAVSLTAVCVLSHFVLTVDVTGNEAIRTTEILSMLHREGVKPGVYGPGLDTREIANRILLEMPRLAWLNINLHGTRAEVQVVEAEPKPAIEDETTPSSIVANVAGILTAVEVRRGRAMLGRGDTVLPGDVLISGIVDLQEPAYSQTDLGVMMVAAAGRVEARTWRTLNAVAPAEATAKEYTGRERSLFSLRIFGIRVNFYLNAGIPYAICDKISQSWAVKLPFGELPFALTRETYREYTPVATPANPGLAEAGMRQALEKRLLAAVNGEILRVDFQSGDEPGRYTAALLAESLEEIGKRVPLT